MTSGVIFRLGQAKGKAPSFKRINNFHIDSLRSPHDSSSIHGQVSAKPLVESKRLHTEFQASKRITRGAASPTSFQASTAFSVTALRTVLKKSTISTNLYDGCSALCANFLDQHVLTQRTRSPSKVKNVASASLCFQPGRE